MADRDALARAIAAQEALRGSVPDEVVDTAIAAVASQLASVGEADVSPRRGQATVLFADVAGFTAMSEDLDAEVVATLMNELWRGVDRAIVSNGGYVDKHIGDAVLGVWGAAATREDDPERAVRAALDLRSAFESFRMEQGLDIDVRIGVNTGPVHFGAVGSAGERSVTGDAVNVASRAEHAAPAGAILITHDTYRHVRGVFDVQQRSPIQVKGKREPPLTYEVARIKARSFRSTSRGVEGIETRLVGRETEFAVLQDAYLEAVRTGRGQTVGVVGEAGAGKSRLLYEFTNWLDLRPESVNYLKGRSTPESREVPLALLRELLAHRLEIRHDDDKHTVVNKITTGLDPLTSQEAQVAGYWLGFDLTGQSAVDDLIGSDQFAMIARSHVIRYLEHLAGEAPTVILLEDVHWADSDSLDAVDELVEALIDAPLLVVWTSRLPFLDRRPEWTDHSRHLPLLRLAPLSMSDTRALVVEILQRVDRIPDQLIELVQEQADGNPFHVEELIKVLIERHVVTVRDDGIWRVDETQLDQVSVPPTLTAVMQARLDGLDVSERVALQRASVVGRTFWDDAVEALLAHRTDPTAAITPASTALEAARRHELVRTRTPSSFGGCNEYLFKHALLRDVAYDTVLLRDRERLHGLAAEWMQRRAGDRLEEYAGQIAEHLERAGRPDEAAAHLQVLAARARDTGSLQRAARAYERLLILRRPVDGAIDADAARIRIELADIYTSLGHADEARTASEHAEREARHLRDRRLLAMALVARLWSSVRFGFWDDASAITEEVRPLVAVEGGALLARFLLAESVLSLNGPRRDIVRAEQTAREACEQWRELHVPAMESRSFNTLGNVLRAGGRMTEAEESWRSALEIAQRVGDRYGEMVTTSNLALSGHLAAREGSGDYCDVIANYEVSAQRSRELGNRSQVSAMNLAQAQTEAGHLTTASQTIRTALRAAWNAGNRLEWLAALMFVGQHRIASGRRDEGLAMIGAVLADSETATMRQEVDAIFEIYDIDARAAEIGLAVGAGAHVDEIVRQLLSEDEPATVESGSDAQSAE
jgi:class 3 adenylate cyclase/tetratricopeptide (TPR) repeat protein